MEERCSTSDFAFDEYDDGSSSTPQGSTFYCEEELPTTAASTAASVCANREVTYTPKEAVEETLKSVANGMSSTLNIPVEYALSILKSGQWDSDKIMERYFEQPEKVFAELKLTPPSNGTEIVVKTNDTPVDCTICWDTVEPQNAYAVECGHDVCKSCIVQHLSHALSTKKADTFPMRCPNAKCLRLWPLSLIHDVLSTSSGVNRSELQEKCNRFAVDAIVESKGFLQWCTSPTGGCGHVVRVPQRKDNAFHVQCHHCYSRFCFNCSNEPHGPATCKMLRDWIKKRADDSETANWVQANTKNCPKCDKIIEKNGGCNHMTCSQCRHEFCWVCNGPWSQHGGSYYACNKYQDNEESSKQNARIQRAKDSLQRYLFYFSRFENHENSKKLDGKVLEAVTRRAKDLLVANECDIGGISYLEDTARTLFDCRLTLKFTYVYGFYLESPLRKLFEYNQSQLEHATEELSFIVEGKLALDRQEVLNRVAVAKKMLSTLVAGKYEE